MKTTIPCLALVLIAFATASNSAQESATPNQADMQKMWEQFAKPGEAHKMFSQMEGTWKTKSTNLMADEPEVTEGKATFKVVMEGRYLVQTYEGTHQGMTFEGMGITGYDNAQKKYVGTWIDNFGTGLMNSVGEFDAATKTMTEEAKMSSPMGEMTVKMVTTHKNQDEFSLTMYMVAPDGKEVKTMEIVYTRS